MENARGEDGVGFAFEQHFGHPVAPLRSLEEAVGTWPEYATSVGLTLRRDGTRWMVEQAAVEAWLATNEEAAARVHCQLPMAALLFRGRIEQEIRLHLSAALSDVHGGGEGSGA